ncbi:hypothetical protein A5320_21160 [Rheinheimera sp. SA_1]|uniref:DUF1993 family protein n=1 Tax=Rheinheimera sp. SA_1 TaxID=1827365 RepID=UPI00080158B4|nr:DUF1993 domain-containing protein [Rheinheimera sp. SA_1]OBP17180.1 hypothetical protein A5320_21160 [Rheinheimera sp. SA_1]
MSVVKNKHIEIFVEFLRLLSSLLDKVEEHFGGDERILHERLSPDMFPLCVQVEIVASFALRSCCPIAGVEVNSYSREVKSFANLRAQLEDTFNYITSLDEKHSNLEVVIEDMAGPSPISMKAEDFLMRFAYPNFYFHLGMVYAIARSRGVPLTKGDFDGLHQYPPGFSFERGGT